MRISTVAIVTLALLAPLAARAEDEEAILSLDLGPSILRVGYVGDPARPATVAGGGGTVRAAYGLSDLVALEVAVGGVVALNAEHRGVMTDDGPLNVYQDIAALRATAGAALRFGARLVPTLSLHAGYQRRVGMNAVLFDDNHLLRGALPGATANELIGVAAAGLELLLDRHWHVGLSAQAVVAVGAETSFLAVEIPLRVSYAFYPRLFRSMRLIRFED